MFGIPAVDAHLGFALVPNEPKRPRLALDDNPEFKKRGQRLFGLILGTLHRTEADNAKKSKMSEKRAETERRLQERLAREKEEIAQKIKEEKEARIARIEKEREEMRIRSAADAREAKRSQLRDASNFLITRTSPPLYYLPSRHVESTQAMLAERKRELVVEFARIAAEEEKEKEEFLREQEAAREKNEKAQSPPAGGDDEQQDNGEVKVQERAGGEVEDDEEVKAEMREGRALGDAGGDGDGGDEDEEDEKDEDDAEVDAASPKRRQS
ncbi:MAG: pinin/SDK/memA/ protein conserved region-domain-containing protein [Olpidium bornovanus]|uniref:Pinin/SDK/memA/ protein conserved region-domain-containing protein n=1 Tax=Olpidium bornovanus TaxID=278681 RepID=A0A8H7ZY95_9FUNG|nr:MAG: pinin/SDK/memA/ protein conserved region-domain-containing protein [Olpidium bornovanus]